MRIRMNNKGYMLVEIILAFSITFALVYFMMNLIIDMKNDNDDLLVKTIVTTDQTIITNELMEYAILEKDNFSCNELKISGKSIIYRDKVINVLNDYVSVGSISCSNVGNKITIRIPLSVKQMEDKIFDAFINYRYGDVDTDKPTCSISVSSNSTTITANYNDNLGVVGYYFGKTIPSESTSFTSINSSVGGSKSGTISSTGTYYFGFKDVAGNIGYCSGKSTGTSKSCLYAGSIGSCYSSVSAKIVNYICICSRKSDGQTVQAISNGTSCKSICTTQMWTYYGQTPVYSCDGVGGIPSSNNKYCIFYREQYKYTCDSGYTKLNDSYCFKVS